MPAAGSGASTQASRFATRSWGAHEAALDFLLPCNAVVREVAAGKVSLELAAPSGMMRILGDENLTKLALEADVLIWRALDKA